VTSLQSTDVFTSNVLPAYSNKTRAQLLQSKGVSHCKIIRHMQHCYCTVRFCRYGSYGQLASSYHN